MAENWLGCNVSVNCGPFHGVYQGQIINVDGKGQTITIKKVFKDGVPHPSSEVVLQAQDIVELNIIKCGGDTAEEPQSSIVAVKKPVPKRPTRSVSETLTTNKGFQLRESPRRTNDNESTGRPNGVGEGSRTPNKKDRNRQKWTERDEACFGSSINNILGHEFDFEKNLALFNKQAVYDEINASQRPDIVKHADQGRRITKYRHDENVIASAPAMYRQIIVPAPDSKEYVTELPSISVDLIVSALLDSEGNGAEQPWYTSVAAWTNESRAAVLALDPPAGGTPGVDTKFSLLPILPLAHSLDSGKLYLCNLACPQQVFVQVGIKYTSPFGPKFVIPLHPNDT
uniref:DFDF domain-containing protein n=1 Tax=Timema bartmani TaxID=61472 RepID=A0A7R9F8B9_9NEOP|nr:unnamed protein product [Timema bartmani]